MTSLVKPMTRRQGAKVAPRLMALERSYRCVCKRAIFFRNSQCLTCGRALGYDPYLGKLLPLEPGSDEYTWKQAGSRGNRTYVRCANFGSAAGCNWLIVRAPQSGSQAGFCVSCRLNRTIPDLSFSENGVLWSRIEVAKRRVVSSLVSLGLPVASRVDEDPERGLAFDLLRSPDNGPRVMTGHADGIITLNIEEADDARREQIRTQMGEPYRTLVGHFRHEIGHYYWDRLVAGSMWLEEFRRLFGDDRIDYGEALSQYHSQGPAPDWPSRCISAYASAHPWEDWAETWAHYLHMCDTIGTAQSFGLKGADLQFESFTRDALLRPDNPDADEFLSFLNSWVQLTSVLNELSRGMGQPDFYPFALPQAAVPKLHLVHSVVGSV